MKKQTLVSLIGFIAFLLFTNYSFAQKVRKDYDKLIPIYNEAVKDASHTLTENDVYDKLVSMRYGASELTEWNICNKDTMVLVASFQKSEWSPIKTLNKNIFYSPKEIDDAIWIFIPKEIEKKLTDFNPKDASDASLRLVQMLGLPPVDKYSIIYYFWVNKNDLVRPSYNPDITTTKGAVNFTSDVSDEYKEWFQTFISQSYNNPLSKDNYPFTRLGYTYDWSPATSRYGVSEFVILPNVPLRLEKKINIGAGEWLEK